MDSDASQTIVLVEDDPGDFELIRIALRDGKIRHALVHFDDGKKAVDALARMEPPALILLDLNLPRMAGKEVLGALRADAKTARVPIVVLSSSDLPDDIRECYALGANSFVSKPSGFGDFSAVVASVARYWTELNRWPT